MSYTIIVTKSIQKDLDNLPNDIKTRVYNKISQLSEDPRPDGVISQQVIKQFYPRNE